MMVWIGPKKLRVVAVPRAAMSPAFSPLDPRPDAARTLPAPAGAREPLAQDGARGHQAALPLQQRAVERLRLAGGAHAGGDERGEQVRGDRQARAFWNSVDAAHQ